MIKLILVVDMLRKFVENNALMIFCEIPQSDLGYMSQLDSDIATHAVYGKNNDNFIVVLRHFQYQR